MLWVWARIQLWLCFRHVCGDSKFVRNSWRAYQPQKQPHTHTEAVSTLDTAKIRFAETSQKVYFPTGDYSRSKSILSPSYLEYALSFDDGCWKKLIQIKRSLYPRFHFILAVLHTLCCTALVASCMCTVNPIALHYMHVVLCRNLTLVLWREAFYHYGIRVNVSVLYDLYKRWHIS